MVGGLLKRWLSVGLSTIRNDSRRISNSAFSTGTSALTLTKDPVDPLSNAKKPQSAVLTLLGKLATDQVGGEAGGISDQIDVIRAHDVTGTLVGEVPGDDEAADHVRPPEPGSSSQPQHTRIALDLAVHVDPHN